MGIAGDDGQQRERVRVGDLAHEGPGRPTRRRGCGRRARHRLIMRRGPEGAQRWGSTPGRSMTDRESRHGGRPVRRRRKRQWIALGLSAGAAAMGAAIAVTPFVVGADREVTDLSVYATAEGAPGAHAAAHTESPGEKRRYARQVARCDGPLLPARQRRRLPGPRRPVVGRGGRRRGLGDLGRPGGRGPGRPGRRRRVGTALRRALHGDPRRAAAHGQGPLDLPAEDRPGHRASGRRQGRQRPPLRPGHRRHEERPAPRRRVRGRHRRPRQRLVRRPGAARRRARAGGRAATSRTPSTRTRSAPGSGFRGARWVVTFDPWTETWTRHAGHAPRALVPQLTELPDGRVLILGGWDETGGAEAAGGPDLPGADGQQPGRRGRSTPPTDVDDGRQTSSRPLGAGDPRPYPDHRFLGLYPHLFVLPDTPGAGARAATRCWSPAPCSGTRRSSTPRTGAGRGHRPRSRATAPGARPWLEPSGPGGPERVVLLGGTDAARSAPGRPRHQRAAPDDAPRRSTSTRRGLQMDAGPRPDPAHRAVALQHRAAARRLALQRGGGYGQRTAASTPTRSTRPSSWSPARPGGGPWGRRATPAPTTRPRSCCPTGGCSRRATTATRTSRLAGRTAQIYSPPYLFRGARPAFTSAPDAVGYGAAFRVGGRGRPRVDRPRRPRPPRRRDPRGQHGPARDRAGVTADRPTASRCARPPTPSLAPPGYYMLHVIDGDGVPSLAAWVRLDPAAPAPPALPGRPGPPIVAPLPAPRPAASGRPAALRLASLSPRAVRRGRGAVVVVRLRATPGRLGARDARRPPGRPDGHAPGRPARRPRSLARDRGAAGAARVAHGAAPRSGADQSAAPTSRGPRPCACRAPG